MTLRWSLSRASWGWVLMKIRVSFVIYARMLRKMYQSGPYDDLLCQDVYQHGVTERNEKDRGRRHLGRVKRRLDVTTLSCGDCAGRRKDIKDREAEVNISMKPPGSERWIERRGCGGAECEPRGAERLCRKIG